MTYTHPPFTAALRSIDLYPGHSVHTATGTLYPDVLVATRRNGRAIVDDWGGVLVQSRGRSAWVNWGDVEAVPPQGFYFKYLLNSKLTSSSSYNM